MTSIGILGGSFDPVHAGHMELARAALAELPIDELRLVPAAQSWQKPTATPASDRVQMLRLALDTEPVPVRGRLALDLREIERGGLTYTIDTLRELRRTLTTAPLVLVMGGDQFERIDTWRDWRALLDFAHIAVARRGDSVLSLTAEVAAWHEAHRVAASGALRRTAAGCTVEFAMTPSPASSTAVRSLLGDAAADRSRLTAMLAPAVLDYIRARHLYRAS